VPEPSRPSPISSTAWPTCASRSHLPRFGRFCITCSLLAEEHFCQPSGCSNAGLLRGEGAKASVPDHRQGSLLASQRSSLDPPRTFDSAGYELDLDCSVNNSSPVFAPGLDYANNNQLISPIITSPIEPWGNTLAAASLDGAAETDTLGQLTPSPGAIEDEDCPTVPFAAAREVTSIDDAGFGAAVLNDGAIVATVRIAPQSIKLSPSLQHIGAPSARSAQYLPLGQYPMRISAMRTTLTYRQLTAVPTA
jgi:hypothetical protein